MTTPPSTSSGGSSVSTLHVGSSDVQPVARSVAELFGQEVDGEPLTADGKSGAHIERVVVDGQSFVLKYLHPADDWLMRATGDDQHRPLTLWRHGWLDRLPDCIDHAVVGAAWEDRTDGPAGVLVMRDVSASMVPDGDNVLPLEQHLGFVDHMAQLHVAFWGCEDTLGLLPLSERFVWFGPNLAERELARGGADPVPTRFVPAGWNRLAERAPRTARIVFDLLDDPAPLTTALATTPLTLVHGDWKAANLGSHPDGRTVLLDWDLPGVAPACADIAWYVCLNRSRLPQSKEAALAAYREALERHGIDTAPWWERQCALSLLGTFLLFGWEKALGDGADAAEELGWWETQVLEGLEHL